MSDKIIQFLQKNEIERERLKKRIDEELCIENPIVSECVKSRVKEVFSKYIIAPDVKIEMEIPAGLSSDQRTGLKKCVRKGIAQYQSGVSKQVQDMILEICLLHVKLCKIKANFEEIKDIFG